MDNTQAKDLGNHIKVIQLKVSSPFIVTALLGGSLMFVKGNIWFIVLGVLIVAGTILMYIKFPNRKVADLYDNGVILYPKSQPEKTILWDDIKMWRYDQGKGNEDNLLLELKDGTSVGIVLFQRGKLVRSLVKYCPNQDYHEIRRQQTAQKTIRLFKRKSR